MPFGTNFLIHSKVEVIRHSGSVWSFCYSSSIIFTHSPSTVHSKLVVFQIRMFGVTASMSEVSPHDHVTFLGGWTVTFPLHLLKAMETDRLNEDRFVFLSPLNDDECLSIFYPDYHHMALRTSSPGLMDGRGGSCWVSRGWRSCVITSGFINQFEP